MKAAPPPDPLSEARLLGILLAGVLTQTRPQCRRSWRAMELFAAPRHPEAQVEAESSLAVTLALRKA